MSFYTLKYEIKRCPLWDADITFTAHYHCVKNAKTAQFVSAECAIVENLRKPKSKQDPKLDMYHYCNVTDCRLEHDFPELISLS